MKYIATFAVLLLLVPAAWAGAKVIDQKLPASSGVQVDIELIAGDVKVEAWHRDEVHVKGTINDTHEVFEMTGNEERVAIEVSPKKLNYSHSGGTAKLTISVPAGAEVSFESISGSVGLEGLTGKISVESVSGTIEAGGPLQEVEVSTVSGTVKLASERSWRSAEVETVSGSIEMVGDLHASGDYSFESVNGTITLRVPAGAGAEYEFETFSGDIKNDFGPTPTKAAEFLPAKSLSFTVGSGGASVEATSFSGTVRLLSR